MAENLLAHLQFERANGSQDFVDSSVNAWTVVVQNGSPTIDYSQAKSGSGSMVLTYPSGADRGDRIGIEHDGTLMTSISGDRTYECWIRYNGAFGDPFQTIFQCGLSEIAGSSDAFIFYALFFETDFTFGVYTNRTGTGSVTQEASAPQTVNQNQWYLLSLVKDGNNIRVYFHGIKIMDFIVDSAAWPATLTYDFNWGGFIKGYMDEVKIYDFVKYTDDFTPGVSPTSSNFCEYVEDGQIREMVSTISGLDHFEGETIKIQMDGVLPTNPLGKLVSNAFTVSSGSITLPKKAAVVHAGLGYDGLIQLLKGSGGSAVGTGQTKMRRTYLAVVRFFKSLGLKVGPSEDKLSPIFLGVPALPLVTGDRRKLPVAPWDDETEMVFKMKDPLPCQILAILLESEVEEK